MFQISIEQLDDMKIFVDLLVVVTVSVTTGTVDPAVFCCQHSQIEEHSAALDLEGSEDMTVSTLSAQIFVMDP